MTVRALTKSLARLIADFFNGIDPFQKFGFERIMAHLGSIARLPRIVFPKDPDIEGNQRPCS